MFPSLSREPSNAIRTFYPVFFICGQGRGTATLLKLHTKAPEDRFTAGGGGGGGGGKPNEMVPGCKC